jgi:16S rRNA (guanine966-N2)-methyltransferase
VIAGRLGGRRLVAPRGLATRPTSDRVREALFAMLGDVSGAVVLDLYAGTGALGIEALSRGAARAAFVENARPAIAALRENLASLALSDRAKVFAQPALRAMPALGREGPFDLLFLDPPYAAIAGVPGLVAALEASCAIAGGARLVVEHATRDPAPELSGLTLEASRAYGDTSVAIYARGER